MKTNVADRTKKTSVALNRPALIFVMPTSALQPRDRSFQPTAWTTLLTARDPASAEAKQAREEVCQAWWRPVCSYLQSLGLEPSHAEDLM